MTVSFESRDQFTLTAYVSRDAILLFFKRQTASAADISSNRAGSAR
jgi:hypothetical protein